MFSAFPERFVYFGDLRIDLLRRVVTSEWFSELRGRYLLDGVDFFLNISGVCW